MSYREPVEEIRCMGQSGIAGAIVAARQTVDTHVGAFSRFDERSLALDALLRDLARLRRREPALDGFITEVERYIDRLHRDLDRLAA